MLHTIEVRASAVTDALLNRLNTFIEGYQNKQEMAVIPPLDLELDETPNLLKALLDAPWTTIDGQVVSQSVEYNTGAALNRLTLISETDGNRTAIYVSVNQLPGKTKTHVYFGYNSSMTYNNYLFSSFGLTTDDWRFC